MTVSGSTSAYASRGFDVAGGVAALVGSRGVASAQFAAAAKLLRLGAEMAGPAAKIAQSAAAAIDAQGQALADLSAGLGAAVDVYA